MKIKDKLQTAAARLIKTDVLMAELSNRDGISYRCIDKQNYRMRVAGPAQILIRKGEK